MAGIIDLGIGIEGRKQVVVRTGTVPCRSLDRRRRAYGRLNGGRRGARRIRPQCIPELTVPELRLGLFAPLFLFFPLLHLETFLLFPQAQVCRSRLLGSRKAEKASKAILRRLLSWRSVAHCAQRA